jgi:hypothetical protein
MPPRAAVHMAASARPPVHDLQIPTSSWVEVWASLFRCPRAFAQFDLQRLHFPMKTQRHTCQNRLKALSASFASPGPTRESHFTIILCDAFDSPLTVAPWRWGSTSMSQTCDHLASFIPKASPPWVGVETSFILCFLLQKAFGLWCCTIAQGVLSHATTLQYHTQVCLCCCMLPLYTDVALCRLAMSY